MAVAGTTVINFAAAESTFGGVASPAGNGVPLAELSIKPSREFIDITDMARSNETLGWIPGKITGEFSFSGQLRLPSSLGALPDHNVLLANAFGQAATVVAGTSVTYNRNDLLNSISSFTLYQHGGQATGVSTNNYFAHVAKGCVVSKLTLEVEGGQPVMISGEGGFSNYASLAGDPRTTGSNAAGATTITLAAGSAEKLRMVSNGMYLQFGSDDNSGAGYVCNAVDRTAGTITLGTGLAATVPTGTVVRPFDPTVSFTGAHLDGVTHAFTFGSNTVGFNKATLNFETGNKMLNKRADSAVAHSLYQGMGTWSGEITVYLEDETALIHSEGFEGTEYAVELRLGGTTAGSRYRIAMPAVRFDVINEVPFSKDDEGTEKTFGFSARRTSGNNSASMIAD